MEVFKVENKIRVTVWNEYRHEFLKEECRKVYPDGIHEAIAAGLREDGSFDVRCSWLDNDPEQGLSQELLDSTDVLFWWGHRAHNELRDEVVERVQKRVQEGMGLIVLHSGHKSRIFMKLMGTTCNLKWREVGEKERIWNVDPSHPIAAGVPETFALPHTEMYGERFDIPTPKDLIFITWYEGGEVFRSGVTFERGYGRIFYFAPGHETFPIYYDPNIRLVLANAAKWAAPRIVREIPCPKVAPQEEIRTAKA